MDTAASNIDLKDAVPEITASDNTPPPLDSIDSMVSQTVERFDIDPTLAALIRKSYESGPLAQVLQAALDQGVKAPLGASTLVLYSGTDPETGVYNGFYARAYAAASNGKSYTIDNTGAGKYLATDGIFNEAISEIAEEYGSSLSSSLRYAIQEVAWRAVSEALVSETSATSLVTFVQGADPSAVFAENEAPFALAKGFQDVNGIDPSTIIGTTSPYAALQSTQGNLVSDFVANNDIYENISTGQLINVSPGDGQTVGTGTDWVSFSDMVSNRPIPPNPGDLITTVDEGTQALFTSAENADADFSDYNASYDVDFSGTPTYNWSSAVEDLGDALIILGGAAIAYDITKSTASAIDEVKAGNYGNAANIMAEMAGRIAGGLEGAELGAELGAAGGPLGVLLGGVVGAVAGATVGQEAVRALENAAEQALEGLVTALAGKSSDPGAIAAASKAMGGANHQISPLVLDLTGGGVNLTPLNSSSPYFDLSGNGFARQTGWVGSNMGILAFDPGDQAITSISQLFGNATTDGFVMLRQLDTNHDNVIDASDSEFNSLRVWRDINGNGITDSGELYTLDQLGIVSINLNAKASGETIAGNTISTISSYTMVDGTVHEIADAWFSNSATQTRADSSVIIGKDIQSLPQLNGSGTLRDLQSAMALDQNLQSQVEALDVQEINANDQAIESMVKSILFEWAGVADVAPSSRGGEVDARELEFVEHALGQNFDSQNDGVDPGVNASLYVQQAWNKLYDAALARLVLQIPSLGSVAMGLIYDPATDAVRFTKPLTEVMSDAFNVLGNVSSENLPSWVLLFRVMDAARMDAGISIDEFDKLIQSTASDAVASVASAVVQGVMVTIGKAGGVVETGSALGDTFYAGTGVSLINGGGSSGNGNATSIHGDVFNYVAGNGSLEIYERDSGVSAENIISFGNGINPSDVRVSLNYQGDVVLTLAAGGLITIDQMGDGADYGVQDVSFSNGITWSREDILKLADLGTSGDDYLFGTSSPEIMDGGGGHDYAQGGGGNDTFVFDAGYGQLEINEADYSSKANNVLKLGEGITASVLTVTRTSSGDSLVLTDGISGDQVTLDSMLSNSPYDGIQTVQFADGTSLTAAQLIQMETTGTAGADSLYGTSGAEVFDGKGGGDYALGRGGNDTFVYNAGYGRLEINEQDFNSDAINTLQLGKGMDIASTFVSFSGNNIVLTDSVSGDYIQIDGMLQWDYDGVQKIQFADGTSLSAAQLIEMAHTITGTTGNDSLTGTSGADLFDGKGGSDYVTGGGGNDTFVFDAGYGQLEINEADYSSKANNVLKLGEGITASALTVTRTSSGNSLVLTDGISGDQVTLDSMLSNSPYDGIQTVQFADGTSLTAAQLIQMETTGTTGADSLYGTSGAEVFDGKGGGDYALGRGGNDTFVFDAGYGQLEINEVDYSSNANNVLRFGAAISASNLRVTSQGNGLELTDGTSGDQVTLDSMLSNSPYDGIQTVQFADGTSLTAAQLIQMETTGTTGADSLYGTSGAEVFDGKGGGDYALGRGGNDTFVFDAGYGQLEINEVDYSSNANNVLRFGAAISASNLRVTSQGNGLELTDGTSGDQVTLDSMLSNSSYDGIQTVQFADGTSLTAAQLIQMETTGTTGADSLYGTSGAEVFDGKGGGDYALGRGGNDTFVYNAGYGQLTINESYSSGQQPVLQLGAGITQANLQAKASGSGIVLTDGTSGDQITLDDMLSFSGYGVQQVDFADGTSLSAAQLIEMAHTITGTTGNDSLTGTSGADLFDGKGGSDYVTGGGGNDTFVFDAGYGQLEINEIDYSSDNNVLQLGAGISESLIAVSRNASGNSLILTDGISGDQITLDSAISGFGTDGVKTVQFADGTSLTAAQLIQMETTGTAGADSLYGTSGAEVFDGKGGGDYALGRGGNDTFVYNAGYGQLTINESYSSGQQPVLQLGAGITQANLQAKASGSGIVLTDGTSGDQITLDDMLSFSGYGVQQVDFADGTSLSAAQLIEMAHTITGTTGNDSLTGTSGADLFDGKGGSDYVTGGGGNDTFVFDAGYGQLEINEIDYSSDNNVLQLGAGISESLIAVSRNASGNSLILTDGISGDQITLDSAISGFGTDGVKTVQFADGTSLTAAQLIQMETTGTAGADSLYGTSGAEVFDGKGGGDYALGRGGNDTFVYNAGYGQLTINESYSSGQQPVLQLGAGITQANLQAKASGSGIVLTDGTSGDQITLDDMLSFSGYGVQQVDFADGTSLSAAQLIEMAHTITGTTGNDSLTGTSGADLFDGKGGSDYVTGGGGNDTFVFDAGYGQLEINEADYSSKANNVLKLGEGITASALTVTRTSSGNSLVLTDGISGDQVTLDSMLSNSPYDGIQTVQFADGTSLTAAQLIQMETTGTTGADSLYGTSGAEVFDGKGGGDYALGRGGNDTFVFDAGYGQLEINEVDYSSNANNVLRFGAAISASNLRVTSQGNGLELTDGTSGDQVTLDSMLSNSPYDGIQTVQFADGTSLTAAQLIQMETTGTTGADSLYGTSGAEVFDGKGGGDYALGRGGNDTFVFDAGYGQLEINEVDYSSNANNVLRFGAAISASNLRVTSQGNGLELTDGTSGDQVTLDSMLSNSSYDGIQTVQFADGTSLTAAQLIQMETTGTTGADSLYGTSGAEVFDGKGGGDYALGRGGNDTFVYNAGYGQLTINESYSSGQQPVLQLGAGITQANLQAKASGSGIVLTDGTSGDQITLDDMLSFSGYGVQQVDFADGTSLSAAQLIEMAHTITGTTGNDSLTGTSGADLFDGKGGSDYVTGGGGNDTFVFDAGYGQLEINEADYSSKANNVLKLGEGITASALTVTRTSSGNSLVLTDGISGDQVTLDYAISSFGTDGIQAVQFADGTSLTAAQLIQMEATGTAGSDSLYGTSGAELFDGKGGGDYALGRGGNDTFVYNAGYGQLTINESYSSGQQPVLQLGAGITQANLQAKASGSGIVLTDGTSGDQITLDDMLSFSGYGVQQVDFADGTSLSAAQLIEMAHTITGTTGNDSLTGTSGADLFDGKGGSDYVTGGGGNDTFVFDAGYGQLEINEADYSSKANNVLKLGEGITASALTVTRTSSGNSLVLTDGISGDQVTLDSMLSNSPYDGIQTVQFADGTSLTAAQLIKMAAPPSTSVTTESTSLIGSGGLAINPLIYAIASYTGGGPGVDMTTPITHATAGDLMLHAAA